MVTLGVNLIGNDTSAAIVADEGTIVAIAEEERYSRVKGGRRWAPPAWLLDVLEEHGVRCDEVRTLAVARIQALHSLRPAYPSAAPGPAYWGEAKRASVEWLAHRLPRCESIVEVRHHLCHAASAQYASPFDSAAVVTADGMGEVETATVWAPDKDGGLRQVWSRSLPHSLGLAYEAVASWAGLTGVEKEGKLMGLAPLGRPKHADRIRAAFIRPDERDVFSVASDVAALPPTAEAWAAHVAGLFGPPGPGGNDVRELDADVAASIQLVLEDCLAGLLARARSLTDCDRCTAAGGVFLNAVANSKLERAGVFEELWFQPLAGDAGTSLGAALAARGPRAPRQHMRHVFFGSALDDADQAARAHGLAVVPDSDLVGRATTLLLDGGILAWASGRAEAGPRALGHRSILADPRHRDIREEINARVKDRELWRPFAPIVLEEDVPALFGSPLDAPFMNRVATAAEPESMAAAVHVDGSARLQTVAVDEPELAGIRALLLEVKARTGYGVLLNTSLNGRGEPIARSAADVISVFERCRLDGLVLEGRLYVRPQEPATSVAPVTAVTEPHDSSCGDWWLLAPWWSPDAEQAVGSLHRAGVSCRSLRPYRGDVGTFRDELREASGSEAPGGVLVAVPVWSEVAVTTLGGLLHSWFDWDGEAPRVICLDEDGRTASWDGATEDGTNAIEDWWSRAAAPVDDGSTP
jgi:carbamoyltransferase